MVEISGYKRHRKDVGDKIMKVEGSKLYVETDNEGHVREDEW